MGTFALVALALAAIGVYGVFAFAVAQRQREIAVRQAVGATRADIVRLLLAHALVPIAAGVGAGVAGALFIQSHRPCQRNIS